MTLYLPISLSVVVGVNLGFLGWVFVLAFRADLTPAATKDDAGATRRRLFTAFGYASVVVLGAGLFALAVHGEEALARSGSAFLKAASLPCFAPVLQVGGTLLVAVWLACVALRGREPADRLGVHDRVACAVAGLGWGLVVAFVLSPISVRF